jgi:hypothetical protein
MGNPAFANYLASIQANIGTLNAILLTTWKSGLGC